MRNKKMLALAALSCGVLYSSLCTNILTWLFAGPGPLGWFF